MHVALSGIPLMCVCLRVHVCSVYTHGHLGGFWRSDWHSGRGVIGLRSCVFGECVCAVRFGGACGGVIEVNEG